MTVHNLIIRVDGRIVQADHDSSWSHSFRLIITVQGLIVQVDHDSSWTHSSG